MTKRTIFYSWQLDLGASLHKNLIQAALEQALDAVLTTYSVTVEPVIDRDTQGIAGTPEIRTTILEKIERASLFVADVTLTCKAEHKKRSPNPNVMFELGYATAVLGWPRIISVMNEAEGGASDLPFDLQNRRWPIRYRVKKNASPEVVAAQTQKLSAELANALAEAATARFFDSSSSAKEQRVGPCGIISSFSILPRASANVE